MESSRRDLLRSAALGAASVLAGCKDRRSGQTLAANTSRGVTERAPDVEVALRATVGTAALDPSGAGKEVWRFEGQVLAGPPSALTALPGSYLGPIFRLRRGQRLRVRFDNALAEPSIVHWHGLDVAQENDGHPRFAVGPGGSYVYELTVDQRAGTYWYHPHAHGRTGPQVYMGLAGLFIVEDPDDAARGLPSGEQELPLVIQDRLLGSDGELAYAPNPMMGLLGDRVFINGRPSSSVDVNAGTYRLRLLNGSNARIYKLAWSDGSPMVVLGSDGGLLAAPVAKPYLMLAPGERAELWADFGGRRDGEVALVSQAFDGGHSGMMGGGMGGGMMGGRRGRDAAGLGNGAPLRVCRFSIKGVGPRLALPRQLAPVAWRPQAEVVNRDRPRRFEVSMGMMQWLLNGRTFEMEGVADNERVRLGTTEEWELVNRPSMMALPHPIHLHGAQFQVIERSVPASWEPAAATVREGLTDEGWKDTFLLMPGERVRIRVRFGRHAGLFLYHCHNLEHEDMGMMRNFLVTT